MDSQTKRALYVGIVAVILVVAIGILAKQADKKPGRYDELAQCIADSGATFYGAFWCPACEGQRADFGKSQALLPYTECAVSRSEQTQECIDAGIESYPTWEFADGSRITGAQSPEALATITGCEAALPGASNDMSPTTAPVSSPASSPAAEDLDPAEPNAAENPNDPLI